MTGQLLIDELTREEWTAHSATFLDNNLYQTWDYGELHNLGSHRRISRAVWMDGSVALAMAQLRIKVLPIARIGIAEINWGPLWRSLLQPPQPEQLAEFMEALRREYCRKKGLGLRVEIRQSLPNLQNDQQPPMNSFIFNGFTLNPSLRPYRTTILDLSHDVDELRAGLNGKWRNCLNRAEQAGLEAECSSSAEHFQRFEQLYQQMWQKKKFPTGVRIEMIRAFQANAPESEKLLVWIVKDQDTDIAAGVFSFLGNTVLYFLGASSPHARRNSNPGYYLQWLNILRSCEFGFRYYDLGGLTDLPDSGVDLFKNRMGGTRVVFPGWFESEASLWQLRSYSWLEKGFRAARSFVPR